MTKPRCKTFDDILENMRAKYQNKKDYNVRVGKEFEELVFNFLKKDTTYKKRFSKVWKWSDYPENNGKSDIGIDIVAEESDSKEHVGIQCKCYDDSNSVDYVDIAKFNEACDRFKIKKHNRILAYTSESITDEAKGSIDDKGIFLLSKSGFRNSSITNWSTHFDKMTAFEPKSLRDDQEDIKRKVLDGFEKHNRGQMIMACGTGKTITSLRIAEDQRLECKLVLYLVPSISLIQQTMREWSDNALRKCRYIAVCSDSSAGNDEGGRIYELERPPSTNKQSLIEQLKTNDKYDMTVIFSTYQSIEIVANGLKDSGMGPIDLILCDEAHRTATKKHKNQKSKTTSKVKETSFGLVHDNENILGIRRLYMTATPKVYEETESDTFSMNKDEFGPIFGKISFYDAVHGDNPVLADFKVKVAVLPEDRIKDYLGITDNIADDDLDAQKRAKLLKHKAKYAATWHAILNPDDDNKDAEPLQKLIVFTRLIENSKIFAGKIDKKEHGSFQSVAAEYIDYYQLNQSVSVKHIDGSDQSYKRRNTLDWLDASNENKNETRIVSNARCLSEGVNVPTLDGVIFMEPKNSMVEVVQSVGRVMRMAKEKEYGYVILPVVIPGGDNPKEVLDKSDFKHVWQVLNALRSHDARLIAECSISGLVKKPDPEGGTGTGRISFDFLGIDPDEEREFYNKLVLEMRSKLVKKVGNVDYVAKYGRRLGKYTDEIIKHLKEKMSDETVNLHLKKFHSDMQNIINENVTLDDSIKIIAQHTILKPVFDGLFQNEFSSDNPVSKKLNTVFEKLGLHTGLEGLDEFYKNINLEINVINESPKSEIHERRQSFIKEIYNSFISSTERTTSIEKGIVYTPIELVDFIINSVQHILKDRTGKELGDHDVEILEPFAGTGTFLTRLLSLGIMNKKSMDRKYNNGMYANEITLLAYYISSVNIETTFKQCMQTEKYTPFKNISYTDTFMINPVMRTPLDSFPIDENLKMMKKRVSEQNTKCIEVVMSNPPWGVSPIIKKTSKRKVFYDIRKRVDQTYKMKTSKGSKKLHEWYIHALRWSADRIEKCGILAFVINSSILRSDSFSGVRAYLEEEFSDIWCYDLRGNASTKKEKRRMESDNVFGDKTKTPVLIMILLKDPKKIIKDENDGSEKYRARILYHDIGDYLSREKKLELIKKAKSIEGIKGDDWKEITPNAKHEWLDQANDLKYEQYVSINKMFNNYKNGVSTNQDEWVYDSSMDALEVKMKAFVNYMNTNVNKPGFNKNTCDPKKGKYSRDIVNRLKKLGNQTFDKNKIRTALYRPFFKQYLYFDWVFNGSWNVPSIFPTNNKKNLTMLISFSGNFSILVTDITPDLHSVGDTKCFPLYWYADEKGNNIDKNNIGKKTKQLNNINQKYLVVYRKHYNNPNIAEEDIFYYIYGLLHCPGFISKFKNHLKDLPHIPMAPNFNALRDAGKKLVDLHLNFDRCEPNNPIKPKFTPKTISSINFGKYEDENKKLHTDKSKILVNGEVLFNDIPDIKYNINQKTPIEWIIDMYKKIIKNNPQNMNVDDVIKAIQRLVYVGCESDRIIKGLPKEFEPRKERNKK